MKNDLAYPNFRVVFAFALFCPVVASWLLLSILFLAGVVHEIYINQFGSLLKKFDLVFVLVFYYLFAVGAVVTQGFQGLILSLIFVWRKTRRGLRAYLAASAWMSAWPILAFLLARKENSSFLFVIAAFLLLSSMITVRLFVPNDGSQSGDRV